ncbi:MAG: hypothetical protein HQL12_03045 [Candidatus Omnitrophica bacterium]|nr:hypothetical protein [Candidatus Omnitrophota bacterium]
MKILSKEASLPRWGLTSLINWYYLLVTAGSFITVRLDVEGLRQEKEEVGVTADGFEQWLGFIKKYSHP